MCMCAKRCTHRCLECSSILGLAVQLSTANCSSTLHNITSRKLSQHCFNNRRHTFRQGTGSQIFTGCLNERVVFQNTYTVSAGYYLMQEGPHL